MNKFLKILIVIAMTMAMAAMIHCQNKSDYVKTIKPYTEQLITKQAELEESEAKRLATQVKLEESEAKLLKIENDSETYINSKFATLFKTAKEKQLTAEKNLKACINSKFAPQVKVEYTNLSKKAELDPLFHLWLAQTYSTKIKFISASDFQENLGGYVVTFYIDDVAMSNIIETGGLRGDRGVYYGRRAGRYSFIVYDYQNVDGIIILNQGELILTEQ